MYKYTDGRSVQAYKPLPLHIPENNGSRKEGKMLPGLVYKICKAKEKDINPWIDLDMKIYQGITCQMEVTGIGSSQTVGVTGTGAIQTVGVTGTGDGHSSVSATYQSRLPDFKLKNVIRRLFNFDKGFSTMPKDGEFGRSDKADSEDDDDPSGGGSTGGGLHKQKNCVSQEMDKYYANLVSGAAVSIRLDVVWVSTEDTDFSALDGARHSRMVWEIYRDVFDISIFGEWKRRKNDAEKNERYVPNEGNIAESRRPNDAKKPKIDKKQISKVSQEIQSIKKYLDRLWEFSRVCRVSDSVQMTEIEIIRRLHADKGIQLPKNQDMLRICFIMRRDTEIRYHFAAAVGKRLFSLKLVSSQRAQLVEHHRAAKWAEEQYRKLYIFMKSEGASKVVYHLAQANNAPEDYDETRDYVKLLQAGKIEGQDFSDFSSFIEKYARERPTNP